MNANTFFERLLPGLPPARIIDVNIGLNWTAVLAEVDGETRCGLASTMGDDPQRHTREPSLPRAGQLHQLASADLAALVNSASPPEVSVGMAAVNALLPRARQHWQDLHAEDVIAAHGAGRGVALIGHFPFVPRLRSRVGTLWVLEQDPHDDDLPASAAPQIVPQADVLAITAMTLQNHTFDGLMALRRPGTLTLLIGPTAPLSQLMFDIGVGIISGAVVDDPAPVMRGVMQGANFHQLRSMGVRLVSMAADWVQL